MTEQDVAMVLDLIRAHYWQKLKVEENDRALMLQTWTLALDDVPLRPYIVNALEWWFKNEEWPPQASNLRERAKDQMRAERKAREAQEALERFSAIPERNYDTSLPALIHEWNKRRKAGLAEAPAEAQDRAAD